MSKRMHLVKLFSLSLSYFDSIRKHWKHLGGARSKGMYSSIVLNRIYFIGQILARKFKETVSSRSTACALVDPSRKLHYLVVAKCYYWPEHRLCQWAWSWGAPARGRRRGWQCRRRRWSWRTLPTPCPALGRRNCEAPLHTTRTCQEVIVNK